MASTFTIGWIVIHFSERFATAVTAVLGFCLLAMLLFGSMLWADHEQSGPRSAVLVAHSEGLGSN